jgi:CheY-like chemotaxis protein
MMAKTLSDMVTLLDWETQVVNSPRAAIELIRRKRPGLILLDLNMPGVDGLEVCRYIQREPSSAGTPVVFVTAEDDPGVKQRAKEAGAMDYLVKPVDFDSLEQTLKKIPAASPGMMPSPRIQVPSQKPSPSTVQPPPSSSPAAPGVTAPPKLPAAPASNTGASPAAPPANPAIQPKPEIKHPVKQSDQPTSG